jgi:hypothetical protein
MAGAPELILVPVQRVSRPGRPTTSHSGGSPADGLAGHNRQQPLRRMRSVASFCAPYGAKTRLRGVSGMECSPRGVSAVSASDTAISELGCTPKMRQQNAGLSLAETRPHEKALQSVRSFAVSPKGCAQGEFPQFPQAIRQSAVRSDPLG